ncbi:endonuclease/exonuclease/phosphatase family protein [Streptomyces sp. NPDC089919]|uniref:endonuclease/exonuclease/phosphatase family protein n=1 Tax=Streptomyces sp. NPDC089919 TaxID=3155188 RepID=UPI00341DCCBF
MSVLEVSDPPGTTCPAPAPTPPRRHRGRAATAVAVGCALLMALHAYLPDGPGNLGSLVQTFLPWAGLAVPALLAVALVRRCRVAAAAALLPAVVWGCLFGGVLADKGSGGGELTVVSHNVDEGNPDPARTARALAASGADLLALQELSAAARPVYERELAARYPYHSVHLGVGLWSRYPLGEVAPVEIMPWTRAVRAAVRTPKGPVAVYAVHLASVRVTPAAGFTTGRRNDSARKLAAALRSEPLPRVLVAGDFNGSTEDAALRPVTSQLRSAQREAGAGFGFTWPAAFPVVRIDQILTKGLTPVSAWTLPETGSDHRPVGASLRL